MRGAAEAASLAAHWTPAHAVANASAIAALGALVAWREGAEAVARVLILAFGLQMLVLLAGGSAGHEYRGASGFAWALAAYALARSAPRSPVAAALVGFAAVGYWAAGAAGAIASPLLPEGVEASATMHAAGALAGLIAAAGPPSATGGL